jgi:hypothetical protein
MRYISCLIVAILFLQIQLVSGQYYDTGQDPSSLKWVQIKTGRFTVIYPEKYGQGGRAFAESLDQAYSKMVTLFPGRKFNIPVIIHNYSTQSNGYVSWAPKRMEIYPTPEQNSVPLDANKQLAVHELTHVFQMESLNTGFSKVMSIFLGQQFTGLVASLLPFWLLEGDAVFAESYLTESGRGRTASFQKELKALTVDLNFYKYDKDINGSYRNFVPDYYRSGFQMVTWALAKYDPNIWNKVLQFTGDEPFTLNPVNISLSRSARLTKKKLYVETFDTLKTIWTKEIARNGAKAYESLNPEKHDKYINYYSPVYAGIDSIIAVKTSLSAPPVIVLINPSQKTEKNLHIPGEMFPRYISYSAGKIVWVETQPDKRWQNRDYSVIKLFNLRLNKTTRLSHKSRYLSAAISPDGHLIAATENTTGNENNLVIIESGTGNIIRSVPSPENVYLQHPQWSEDGKKITFVFLSEAGEGITSYSPDTHTWNTFIEAGRTDLQSSVLRNDSLFFISSLSGTDNIYLKTPDNKVTSLTRSRFGTTDISLSNNKLLFSDYTSGGNSICSTGIKEESGSPGIVSTSSFLINRIKTDRTAAEPRVPNNYIPVPYRKWQHLFRFHSWMPFYADIQQIQSDPTAVRPGATILTQNSLSTLTSSIGYEYSKERNNVFHSRITWKGWYTIIESELDFGNNPQISKAGETVANPSTLQPALFFTNTVSLPLLFSSGSFSQYLRPSFSSEYKSNYVYIKERATYDHGQNILSGRLYFSNYIVSALRDIFPKWAQTFDLNYSFAPFDKDIYGSAVYLKTSFYFPGLLPNNGIKIRFETEKQYPSVFLYGSAISFPRGYTNILSTDLNFLSIDYAMPVAYPDFTISSLLYIKRIRTGLFYDYASGTGNYYYDSGPGGLITNSYYNYTETFKSFGIELMTDFHILRIPFMMSGGVQSAWKTLDQKPSFMLLFNIDLFGLTIGKKGL